MPVTTIFSVCGPSARPVAWKNTAWFSLAGVVDGRHLGAVEVDVGDAVVVVCDPIQRTAVP